MLPDLTDVNNKLNLHALKLLSNVVALLGDLLLPILTTHTHACMHTHTHTHNVWLTIIIVYILHFLLHLAHGRLVNIMETPECNPLCWNTLYVCMLTQCTPMLCLFKLSLDPRPATPDFYWTPQLNHKWNNFDNKTDGYIFEHQPVISQCIYQY